MTRLQYEDPQFVREFRKQRGNRPRPYEARLLRRLLAVGRTRRKRLGLSPRQPLMVLDVGTGYGRDLGWLQAQPGIRAFGIDYAMAMLQAAQANLRVTRGTIAQMDARKLGIRDACLDVVRAQAVFHHMRPKAAREAMQELARVLKPGGLARVFVRYGRREGFLREPGLGTRYFRYYTLSTLWALLARAGLRLLEHERVMARQKTPCLTVIAEKPFHAS